MMLTTFIKRQKLLRAERILVEKNSLTVKELASHLGYSDSQYFIARFKEQWGNPPAATASCAPISRNDQHTA